MPAESVLENLARSFRLRVGRALGRALFTLVLAVLLCGAHLARLGTPLARGATAAALCLAVLFGVVWLWLERRRWRGTRRIIRAVLAPADQALCDRSLRALTLVERTAHDETLGSNTLARLHFDRVLERASPAQVLAAAARRAQRLRLIGLLLVLAAVLAIGLGPLHVIEGLDVLAARKQVAPVPLSWLGSVQVSSQAPHYLRQSDTTLFSFLGGNGQPAGSVLTVHGVPYHEGRNLVLWDGVHEVPFVSDGSGGLVARWTLTETSQLQVAARFGAVLIPEPEALRVEALRDRAPVVELEDAPSQVELKKLERLELRYAALDDHGLTQVDLVLRSGDREDRRTLAKLTDEAKSTRGGHALEARDAFLRRMYLPVVVTIEARDNDAIVGPKWGKSEAIVITPPALGELEAERYKRVDAALTALVDLLAVELVDRPREPKELALLKERERAAKARAIETLQAALESARGGMALPPGLRSFLAGQARLLQRPKPGVAAVRNTEDVALAVDAVTRSLSVRDARNVAKRLADVAEEAADGAKQARETERRDAGLARLDAAIVALDESAKQLSQLGALGRDLGSVTTGDLGRIRRSRAQQDLMHTEFAARHLAERLRRPDPSFGSAGSSRPGGVESGGRASSGNEASQADQRFNQLADELEELANEHADSLNRVEEALAEAERNADLDELRGEAKERADALRRAIADLPQLGADPASARGSAALGREHAGAMAQNLERLDLADAVESGKSASNAFRGAEDKAHAQGSPWDFGEEDALKRAQQAVREQLAWAEERLRQKQQDAEARARSALNQASGKEQDFARRAGNLAGRGKQGETALPSEALDNLERAEHAMRDAAREFENGKGEAGLTLQRAAQRLLEQADMGRTDSEGNAHDNPSAKGEGGRDMRTDGDVPEKQNLQDAEEFRRRVLRGLSKSSNGRLSQAVKRYAEGLLR